MSDERTYYQENKEAINKKTRVRTAARRYRIIDYYSNGKLCCALCGEDRYLCLTVDHIEGGGRVHRKAVGRGDHFYLWIERNGYPNDLRILCMNCQFIENYKSLELLHEDAKEWKAERRG